MSILIKDMDMPKCCAECDFGYPFRNYIADYASTPSGYYCRRLKKIINEYKSVPDNCPLVEVPTNHGRLIDCEKATFPTAYHINDSSYAKGWNTCLSAVLQSPTIIEAEE